MSKHTQWIFFDFGGCLDSDGEHSRDLFFKHFCQNQILKTNEALNEFQNAYSFADRMINQLGLTASSKLMEMNTIFCSMIDKRLDLNTSCSDINHLAQTITTEQAFYLNRNRLILSNLQKKFKMGIVSNFSGNLDLILQEFALNSFFEFVLDSYHVKLSKPDKLYFQLALNRAGTNADQVFFVGDNVDRDIIPAKHLGMKTVHITKNALSTAIADFSLNSLNDLSRCL